MAYELLGGALRASLTTLSRGDMREFARDRIRSDVSTALSAADYWPQ